MDHTVMNTAIGDITPTKFGIDLMADALCEAVHSGKVDPLTVYIRMNALEQVLKLVKERIAETVKDEVYKHPKQKAELLGASVSVVDVPRFDYSDNEEWVKLENTIIEAKMKQQEIEQAQKEWHKGDLPVKSVSQSIRVKLSS